VIALAGDRSRVSAVIIEDAEDEEENTFYKRRGSSAPLRQKQPPCSQSTPYILRWNIEKLHAATKDIFALTQTLRS
jgi:hypothetical protein